MTPAAVILAVVFLISCVIVGLFVLLVLNSIIEGHDLPTSRKVRRVIVKMLAGMGQENKIFYDLGCGRGTLAIFIKGALPAFDVYGLDKSGIRLFFARLKALALARKINFIKENILQADLSKADVLYVYLWYSIMPVLEKKLDRELKKGTLVITNTVRFPNWKPIQTMVTRYAPTVLPDHETLFVYVKH